MMHPDVRAEVMEHAGPGGRVYLVERLERRMPPGEIPSDRVNIGCEACGNYGRNLACPPYSPYIADYMHGCQGAEVICYRVPLEQFEGVIMEERYEEAYALVRGMLVEELSRRRLEDGLRVAGSGPCMGCDKCTILNGSRECRFPGRRIYSLEAMGVSVVLLSEAAFGIALDWSGAEAAAETVTALGAVFIGCKQNSLID